MIQRHRLNEKRKRLEPAYTLCQFCQKRNSERMDTNCFVPVYKKQDSVNVIVFSSVSFQKISIGNTEVPTMQIHSQYEFFLWDFVKL